MADVFDTVLGRGSWRGFCRYVNDRGGFGGQFAEDAVRGYLAHTHVADISEDKFAQLVEMTSAHKKRERAERATWSLAQWEDELRRMERRHADNATDLRNEITRLKAENQKLETALAAKVLRSPATSHGELEATVAVNSASIVPVSLPPPSAAAAAAVAAATPPTPAMRRPRNEESVVSPPASAAAGSAAAGSALAFEKTDTYRSLVSGYSGTPTPRREKRGTPGSTKAMRRTATTAATPVFSTSRSTRRSMSSAQGTPMRGFDTWREQAGGAGGLYRGDHGGGDMLAGAGAMVSKGELVGYFSHLEKTIQALTANLSALQVENHTLQGNVDGMEGAVCQAAVYANQRSKMLLTSCAIWKAHEAVKQQLFDFYQVVEVRPHKRLELLHGLTPILQALDANIALSKSMLGSLFTETELQHCGVKVAPPLLVNELAGEGRAASRSRTPRRSGSQSSRVRSASVGAASQATTTATPPHPSLHSPPMLVQPHRVATRVGKPTAKGRMVSP